MQSAYHPSPGLQTFSKTSQEERVWLWAIVLACCNALTFFGRGWHTGSKQAKSVIPPAISLQTSPKEPWYKGAIIYTLDTRIFMDSDGDGNGDFNGLTSRLGYIDSLGADAIWLAPFQPTPGGDDGYDIADYYSIDKRLGTMDDFERFMQAAQKKGLRIIMDLVVNHTSDQHPWFQEARRNKQSPYYNWYVWSKDRPANYNKGMVFPGVQDAIWSYDSVAGEYYYHRFYNFQPDLNTQNPALRAEIKSIIRFWMNKGITGFRLDAVPFFIEIPEKTGEDFKHDYAMLYDMHRYMDSLNKDAVILGEVNVLPDENIHFFGEHGEGTQMMLNFFVNQHLFYALATGNVKPLSEVLQRTADIPSTSQWAQFLRNHDELNLGNLTTNEQNEVYRKFAPQQSMQIYDRGIRRRLAPMMNNDSSYLRLAYSILFSLQSTPIIRYGDEIGMGDDLELPERIAVRTPMQWSHQMNAGFTANSRPVRPVINDSVYGYARVNVEDEIRDSSSLLSWTKKMIRLRRQHPEIAYGKWTILNVRSGKVLAMRYQWHGKTLITVHNFSDSPEEVSIHDLNGNKVTEVFSNEVLQPSADSLTLRLQAYQYKWLELTAN